MIIFDLDGTLADCEHRRHFVDPAKNSDYVYLDEHNLLQQKAGWYCTMPTCKGQQWVPNWKSFYEACDQDKPIEPVIQIFRHQITLNFRLIALEGRLSEEVNWQIWSGRSESVRSKTEYWLNHHIINFKWGDDRLKMRAIGDNTPDDILKERWLDQALKNGSTIDFVFDDRPKVVKMWRRRGIFVFNCAQTDEDF